MPVMELTMEQEFAYRRLEDLLPEADKADLITVFMALQKQNYCLTNTIKKLLAEWPIHPTNPATTSEEPSKFGILLEIRDLGST
jgi:hypothetical protein